MPPLEAIGTVAGGDTGQGLAVAGPLRPPSDMPPQDDSRLAQIMRKLQPIGEIAKGVVGAGEAAAKVAGELVVDPLAQSAAGLAGVAKFAQTGNLDQAVDTIEHVQKATRPYTVYEPQTEAGQRYAGQAEQVLALPGQAGQAVGDAAQHVTGSPTAGALADAATELGLGVLGGKAVHMGVRAARPHPALGPVGEVAEPAGVASAPEGAGAVQVLQPGTRPAADVPDVPGSILAQATTPAELRLLALKRSMLNEARLGIPREQIVEAYRELRPLANERGALSPLAESAAEKALRLAREQRAATETGDPLEDLTTHLQSTPPGTIGKRLSLASRFAAKMTDAKDRAGSALGQVQASSAVLHDMLTRPVPWTQFKDLLGKWTGELQRNNLRLREFTKEAMSTVPDKLRREAMTNYIQADGDMGVLAQRAAKSRGTAKLGYEVAQNLTPEETALADRISRYHERRLQQAQDAGLLDEGIENYVMQSWQRPNPFTKKLVSDIRHRGDLKPDPSFVKKRVFDSYFEGEQAGFAPATKDIGYLVGSYDKAFNRALAARGFIKGLSEGKANDGRPLVVPSGAGRQVGEGGPEAYMIRGYGPPSAKELPGGGVEDYGDYLPINHPALRKWTWATKDEAGNPIFVKGDLLVHPGYWKHLRAALESSRVRAHPVGRMLLAPSRLFKEFRLALSMFHPTQLAEHAVMHKVNPFNLSPIDMENPVHRGLVEHGLQVSAYDGLEDFAEGVYSTGLMRKIPGIGTFNHKVGDWLFNDYIPRLKVTLGEEALQRNTARYPNLDHDQLLELTAQQANAAFGELNYKMMGRHPSTQDVLRLVLFAPDFLEARGRFVGQALKPYGREQAAALTRGALGMYFTARVLNKVLDDDYHWNRPFSVVHNGHEYTLRTIQGDIVHLLSDPRSFVYHRLNPVNARTALEALTGRDAFGRQRDFSEQMRDLLPVPIPFESLTDQRGRKLWESLLQGFGVTEYKYKTNAERVAAEAAGRHMGDLTPAEQDAARSRSHIREELRQGANGDLEARVARGELTPQQAKRLRKESHESDLVRRAHFLRLDELLDVWKQADANERRQLRPILGHRLAKQMTPEQRQQVLQAIKPTTTEENADAATH